MLQFSLSFIQNNEEILDLLLRYGADVETTNLYGETPLHLACRVGNTCRLRLFLRIFILFNSGNLIFYFFLVICI